LAFNVKSVYSSKVQGGWNKLVERFGSEISVLLDAPVEEIKKESGDKVGDLIWAYRNGKFSVIEGGGGRYGKIVFDQGSQSMLDFFIR
jgi:PHP family Zn ribbon phosphoesterase